MTLVKNVFFPKSVMIKMNVQKEQFMLSSMQCLCMLPMCLSLLQTLHLLSTLLLYWQAP